MIIEPSVLGSQSSVLLKGVLFDLGSTLQEYKHEDWKGITGALNRTLYKQLAARGHAHRLPPLDSFLELVSTQVESRRAAAASTLRSFSMRDVLEPIFEQYGIEEPVTHEYLGSWYQHLTTLMYIRPDVEPTLRLLRGKDVRLGLVSNTTWPAAMHDPDLERFGIKDLLECRLYSCEVGWEKPAPQIFKAALDCMELRPEETAFVGDFLRYDVAGAQAAGMKGIWKFVEGRPEEIDDHSVVPDAIIRTIGELPGVLEKLYKL